MNTQQHLDNWMQVGLAVQQNGKWGAYLIPDEVSSSCRVMQNWIMDVVSNGTATAFEAGNAHPTFSFYGTAYSHRLGGRGSYKFEIYWADYPNGGKLRFDVSRHTWVLNNPNIKGLLVMDQCRSYRALRENLLMDLLTLSFESESATR